MNNAKTKPITVDAKEYLRSLRYEREYIQDLIIRTNEMRVFAEGVGSALRSIGAGSSSSGDSGDSKMTNGVAKLMEVQKELVTEVDKYAEREAAAMKTINRLKGPSEKRVLLLYYFPKRLTDPGEPLFRSWDEVAEEMKCDVRTAQNYHGKALDSFVSAFKEK